MKNSIITHFTMTMTAHSDRYSLYYIWVGHGGHGGHGIFHTHTYARAGEQVRVCLFSILYFFTNVYKNTMTTMTSMTILVIARVVAVMVYGHGKIKGDHTKNSISLMIIRGLSCS